MKGSDLASTEGSNVPDVPLTIKGNDPAAADHTVSPEATPSAGTPSLSADNDPQIKDMINQIHAVIYPGSTIPDGKSNSQKQQHGTHYELIMLTKDEPTKVGEYYRDHMDLPMENKQAGITLVGMNKKVPIIIVIYQEDGMTRISFSGYIRDADAPTGPGK